MGDPVNDDERPDRRGRQYESSLHVNVAVDSGKERKPARAERVKDFAYRKTPDKFKNASGLQIRFRTGVVYVVLCLICILASDTTTVLFLSATAGICAGEFYYMLRSDAKMPNEWIGVVGAVLYPASVFFFGLEGAVGVTMLLLVSLTLWYVFWIRARVQDVGVCFFGAVYTGLQLSGLVFIRTALPDLWGGVALLVVFLGLWGNDAFAYLFGSRFGRHKLAPRTSPNKSWEGFAAGLLSSMLIWCLMLLVPGVSITVYQALLFGLICGLAGVLGDLCESRIKRSVGFKDSGTIMPGHGGLFDRCDSLMTTAVAASVLLIGAGCIPLV